MGLKMRFIFYNFYATNLDWYLSAFELAFVFQKKVTEKIIDILHTKFAFNKK